MTIRKSGAGDIDEILLIYSDARRFMRDNGNPAQWKDGYPPREMIEHDIKTGKSYLCAGDNGAAAVFRFDTGRDPDYEVIDGAWLNSAPYGVVHRIASRQKGAGEFCLRWCLGQCGNIRIDTHKDNIPMRCLLAKLGFTYCGIIRVLNGTEERMAFHLCVQGASR